MGCGCCGGPLIGCGPGLCGCSTSNVYRVALIGIGGSGVGVPTACCAGWNRTWNMAFLSGPSLITGLACHWRQSNVASGCAIQEFAHLFAMLTNPCLIYLEFTLNTAPALSPLVPDDALNCRYSCDDFDCNTGGLFANREINKCTGWPLTLTVSKVP